MYRSAIRASARAATKQATLNTTPRRFAGRLSVPPADGPRSWKNSLARLGLAAGGVWYYSTSDVFADNGSTYSSSRLPIAEADDENFPTVEAIAAARKARQSSASSSSSPSPISAKPSSEAQAVAATSAVPLEGSESGSPEDLEEEAAQQGAFNEETGEINWDCPCLGGMAHGPCGPEFREAFSCFVFSKDEPKGIDCIDKFKGMQDCFRAHPDVYGAELSDDEDESEQSQAPTTSSSPSSSTSSPSSSDSSFQSDPAKSSDAPFPVATHHDPSHGDSVPKAAFSATTVETGAGLPPGATKYESEEDKTKRAKAAKEQVERDHGGKEARSEDGKDMRTAAQHGLGGNSDDRDAPKKGGW